ncbi:BsuBI/PstI family type II restriction endonuclease [Thalassotalea psychrophila]|uniref:BsuBI/PstI family type II restriction endonuclease n=1 Tax=Thalassotalea psychrophila TaxID=3065647 RepID=A0ABY9TVZ7_9GAMM|nr:BsuBI/PstI family type II restriction endonuclease [Colwelliaceae bacterium SQ149]
MAKLSVNEKVKEWISSGELQLQVAPQGVTKERVAQVLAKISRHTVDIQDAVFALLDDSPNWYPSARDTLSFSDGACTAFIGAHVAILQRGSDAKLDREGRDYWIKPLREVGAIEPCYLPAKKDKVLLEKGLKFYDGHPKAKSPNNAYRLSASFIGVLKAEESEWEEKLSNWINEDDMRIRLEKQAQAAEIIRKLTDSEHSLVIEAGSTHYAPNFLKGFEVIYIDDGDGERITDSEKSRLMEFGLEITNHDAMPDILLWNRSTDELWVYEAVTSDGEVDQHKFVQLQKFCERNNKSSIGFTTAYPTWKKAAERQKLTNNNLAINTYMWIVEDGSKQFKIEG